ncbi:CDP-diacylglycerol--glycerol-3-phosphate 3-phosphatidyltransferase [Sinisalibacter aestuarii]|uniref:CDP-diacylglycerol--glycerol-3-phosphate 3-phosphatidyltransferase n=1 Tax=Sinisalibacter aestuarii TaxID=2949426 RepID=A0ABQ5LP20_9RHOB|nr:CDP-diacylglycerol--glycerol-3-phosphate 3-phosphatidyltransferase [Sinisalibacter aestuarii]GKY86744.1 CDP-diacylglycerol--glycerol-3-phosphate 3-phosphatidyltransferase [Sinisalibacter aestuarii]
MKWTLPNILTIARLVAVPLIPVMFLFFARPWADWYAMILFIVAAVTDYLDGYLARAWKLETLFGAAMDPIADKALVMIALLVINGYAGLTPWIMLPSAIIIYREVFVSGLRETLGDRARALKVTNLAKWKTTAQMVAITLIFAKGVLEHHAKLETGGERAGLLDWSAIAGNGGIVLLWVAGLLTIVTGWDYFRKAMPFLRETPDA